jgi:transcriptional regulator with XRE-family HTH domain
MNGRLTLGEYVRRRRRAKGWQLHQLASATGMAATHLSRIENDNALPNADSVVKLAKALDGELEVMLELANCLPREIMERLLRRVDDSAPALHRSAGQRDDPGYARALVEDIDPDLRNVLAAYFGLSGQNIDGLFSMLRGMKEMPPAQRDAVFDFLAARVREAES